MTSDLTVVGLGCAGLPLTLEACRAGLVVKGFDYSLAVVEGLNSATSHGDDIVDDDVADMNTVGLVTTVNPTDLLVRTS
jgi:UDP-N-acetyl-D-glucosamine dehydrogenase